MAALLPQPSPSHSPGFKTPQEPNKPWLFDWAAPPVGALCLLDELKAIWSKTNEFVSDQTQWGTWVKQEAHGSLYADWVCPPRGLPCRRLRLQPGSCGNSRAHWGLISRKQMPWFTSVLLFPVCRKNHNHSILWQDVCVQAKIACSVQFAAISSVQGDEEFSTSHDGRWLAWQRPLHEGSGRRCGGVGKQGKNLSFYQTQCVEIKCVILSNTVSDTYTEHTKYPFFGGSWA